MLVAEVVALSHGRNVDAVVPLACLLEIDQGRAVDHMDGVVWMIKVLELLGPR